MLGDRDRKRESVTVVNTLHNQGGLAEAVVLSQALGAGWLAGLSAGLSFALAKLGQMHKSQACLVLCRLSLQTKEPGDS